MATCGEHCNKLLGSIRLLLTHYFFITGILVITIIDVNDFPPTFASPWTKENPHYMLEIPEEQPVGSIVDTFVASDVDSNIAAYAIEPASEYFEISNATGKYELVLKINVKKGRNSVSRCKCWRSILIQMAMTSFPPFPFI